MLRTSVSELTSLVNSDSPWKVSKGRRSATRRTRNIVGKGTENCAGVIHSNPEHSNMPVSESEKRGTSVLGCSFSDKVEHVPIKKRRFLLRTSSPPPPPSSPARHDISVSATKETADLSKNQDASNELAAKETADLSKNQAASNELAAKEPAFSEINSSQITDSNISDQAKKLKKASDILGYDEDFSGMSILAAAACSSSSGKECGYVEEHSCVEECSEQEQLREIFVKSKDPSLSIGLVKDELVASREILIGGASSCVSTEPVGELLSLSTTVSSLQNVETFERCVEGAVSRDVMCSKDEKTLGNRSSSSRDDRLHWDLNVMMDDWEQSFEDSDAHNELSHNKSDDGEKFSYDDKRERLEGLVSRNTLATTLDKQNTLPLPEPVKLPVETSEEYEEQSGDGADHNVSNPISSDVKSHVPNYNNDLNQTKSMVEDANYVHHLESVSDVDKLVTSVLDDRCQLPEAKTINKGEDLSTKNLKLLGDGNNLCKLALDVKSSLSGAPCELEKSRGDSPFGSASACIQTHFCISSNPDTKKEVTLHLAGMDNVEESPTLHDETVSIEKIDLKMEEPAGHSNVVVSSEISLPCVEATDYASSKYEVATSDKMEDVSVSQSGSLVKVCETASIDNEIQQVTSKETHDSLFSDSCKANVDNNLCLSDKIDTIEKHDHSDGAYLDCHSASVVRVSSESRLHEDYDSQYEDGELRETNECAWDEYCAGSDAEPMVCEEDMETCAISPTRYHVSESGQVGVERKVVMEVMSTIPSSVNNSENEGSTKAAEFEGDDGTDGDKNKINSNNLTEEIADTTRSEEFPEISRSSLEIMTGVSDDNERNVATPSCGDVLVDSVGTETRTEAKSYRRGLRSQIEAPVAQDDSCRDERLDKVESRYEESSCVRSSERVRYPVHGQGRGRGSWNGSFDGRRGFKRRYSPIFHGQLKGDDDGIVEREDMSQNDAYAGIHSRCKPERKFSPDRLSTFGRERPFRYGLSADSRAGRGRYNGPSKDEIFQSSLKYRRPLSHRERSLSPFGGRGHPNAYHSRGKSPSRSRSRSPLMLNSQRGRPGAGCGSNTFMRHRSRSPNFRPEVRVQRPRSPIHQPGFTADRAMGFRSFPRNNYSSPPRSRWTSGRKDESGHFRDFGGKQRSFPLERSPGRNIKRTDRPGVIDSLRNMKPDGYYRISEEGAGREFRYEENYEDRRKHYGTICPNRRSFEDGMTNRLHQDMSESFSGNSIRDRDTSGFQGRGLKGMGCRIGDLPRLRGEHHSFIHEREGKFNSNSKQFVPDVMGSSSDMQSKEQYQSRPGRFPVVDGPSRGRRYENYEDRRKQYGGVFRRNELEGTEKRVNHFFDRNFQDGPFFPRRSVRNFDGQIGSLSTRLGEHHDSVVSRQEEKLEDNPQSFGGENSDDHDTSKGRIAS